MEQIQPKYLNVVKIIQDAIDEFRPRSAGIIPRQLLGFDFLHFAAHQWRTAKDVSLEDQLETPSINFKSDSDFDTTEVDLTASSRSSTSSFDYSEPPPTLESAPTSLSEHDLSKPDLSSSSRPTTLFLPHLHPDSEHGIFDSPQLSGSSSTPALARTPISEQESPVSFPSFGSSSSSSPAGVAEPPSRPQWRSRFGGCLNCFRSSQTSEKRSS